MELDPDLLFQQNVVSHLGLYRRDLLVALGGLREGFEGSQDHDLALRFSMACGAARVNSAIAWSRSGCARRA